MRKNMSLPRVVLEYEDVFSDELPELPPPRDVVAPLFPSPTRLANSNRNLGCSVTTQSLY